MVLFTEENVSGRVCPCWKETELPVNSAAESLKKIVLGFLESSGAEASKANFYMVIMS